MEHQEIVNFKLSGQFGVHRLVMYPIFDLNSIEFVFVTLDIFVKTITGSCDIIGTFTYIYYMVSNIHVVTVSCLIFIY